MPANRLRSNTDLATGTTRICSRTKRTTLKAKTTDVGGKPRPLLTHGRIGKNPLRTQRTEPMTALGYAHWRRAAKP